MIATTESAGAVSAAPAAARARRSLAGATFATFTFCILLLSTGAFATQVEVNEVHINLDKAGLARVTVNVQYKFVSTDKAYYLAFARILNVKAQDSGGPLECVLEKQTYGTQISCTPNIQNRTNYSMQLSFDASDLVTKTDGKSIFAYSYAISNPTDILKVSVRLPEGTGLIEGEAMTPPNATVGSTGRQVTLDWQLVGPTLGKTYTFEARFEPLFGIPFTYDYLYAVVAVVLVLIIYFWRTRRVTRTKTILSVLSSKEKMVLEALLSKGSSAKQRDVVRVTGFSKAKVSRIIAALEERGLIKKQPLGRTNRIILVDKRLKKIEGKEKSKESEKSAEKGEKVLEKTEKSEAAAEKTEKSGAASSEEKGSGSAESGAEA